MKVSVVFTIAATAFAQAQASNITTLIVGGTVVPAGEKTYTVGLRTQLTSENFCGGSLISPTHVLTAAHCPRANIVSIGSHYLSGSKDGERIRVKKQTLHPHFDEDTLANDYSIIELATPSTFPPTPLSSADSETFALQFSTALGWGTTSFGGKKSSELQRVDLPVIPDAVCKTAGFAFPLMPSMMCAGGADNMDTCNADSGGPLILEQSTGDVLVGVVTGGDGCGKSGKPGVYSKVSFVKNWILHIAPTATFV